MPDLIVVSEAGSLTIVEGSGTVYGVSVVSANGFAGSVAKDTTLPAITISTTVTGLIKGNGTKISAATAGTDFVLPGGALGTPSSGTLTSCTGLPISTGVSGLGTGAATFLATPSSANLIALLTDETGTGAAVFANTPTLVTPTIGVATATSINKVAITQPATGSTLTIVDGATLTASATASVSKTNTGDNAINTLYSSLISDATVVLTNGTAISITGTYPSFTVTNSAPDQTVALTAGSGVGITGTYPSFTITATGSGGTVTTASVVSANGFAGSVATATSTPAITITTSITGILKGNATAISAATAGTDYVVPSGSITGSAASLSATLAVLSGGTGVTTSTGSGANALATSAALTTPTITGLNETKTAPTISSGVLALNCALGNVFHVSLNAAITSLTFSNIPSSGTAYGLTLAFTADGTARAVTWPAAVKWSGGTAPTLTSTNAKVDIFVLTTWDGGTTWFAMIGGQNF